MLAVRRRLLSAAQAAVSPSTKLAACVPSVLRATAIGTPMHPYVQDTSIWGSLAFSTNEATSDGNGTVDESRVATLLPPAVSAPTMRTIMAQRMGAKRWGEVVINDAYSVARLTEEIKKKLELAAPLDSITLSLAGKRADGGDASVELDSMDTVGEAVDKALKYGLRLNMAKLLVVVHEEAAATASPAATRIPVSGPFTFPSLPPAISFTEVILGGETWLQAMVPLKSTGSLRTAPVFFTVQQLDLLHKFIREEPNEAPRALMLVGTIKSGKSTLLHKLLPGMIAAAYASADWQEQRLRPVIFSYSFPLGVDAEIAAMDFSHALAKFADKMNLYFRVEATPGAALDNLPGNLKDFSELIKQKNGELWLLLDELQGPGLGSTPSMSTQFTNKFKSLVKECSPMARIVVTGSGLFTLLNSFRTAHLNGFALWEAVTFAGIGSEPSSLATQAMAARLLEQYSVSWPQSVRAEITPAKLVDTFAPSAHGELTSARPALLAFALGCMGDASTGGADIVLGRAQGAVLGKLRNESVRDTLSTLVSMRRVERSVLRDIVSGEYTCAELMAIQAGKGAVHFKPMKSSALTAVRKATGEAALDNKGIISLHPEQLAALIGCLREKPMDEKGTDIVRLQPPYALLLRSWIRRNGALAVDVHDNMIDLDLVTRSNLVLIGQKRRFVKAPLWSKVSAAVWASLISNGIGVRKVTTTPSGKPTVAVYVPASAGEFYEVPALARLNTMLSAEYLEAAELQKRETDEKLKKQVHVPPMPTLYSLLRKGLSGPQFQDLLGKELILAFRHFQSHIWGEVPELVHNGLTAAIVGEAVDAAVVVLGAEVGGYFAVENDKPDMLTVRKQPNA